MTNCAMMGVDWRDLTLWQYQALLSEWNDRHSDEPKAREPGDMTPLRRAMAAASVH